MRELLIFFSEVKSELSRVVWPTKDEFFEMLVAVAVVVLFFSIVLAGEDFCFSFLLKRLMS